jgi:LPS export ABC transporter protein LptC
MMRYLSILFVAVSVIACDQPEAKEPLEYKGPLREVENMEMFYTENDHVKVKMQAALVYEFLSGDREFPKGVYLEFYTEEGALESTLKANNAYFFKEQNLWRGRGKVEVKNIAKKEQLNTEELFWKQTDQKIYTEQFVTIKMQDDVIYGTGLDAKQDLSDYVITHPYGDMDYQGEVE